MIGSIAEIIAPQKLDDIVGQPLDELKLLMDNPVRSCWLAVGTPGTGKTVTGKVLAKSLGCHDSWTGLHVFPCARFGIEEADKLFNRNLRLVSMSKSGFHFVMLEECEWLSPQVQRFLKHSLDPETAFDSNVIVYGTSNSIDSLDEGLVERFRVIEYSSGDEFKADCMARLTELTEMLGVSVDLSSIESMERFSMRQAIKKLEQLVGKLDLVQS